jgi:Ca2+-binding RTX toxin-like protein
VLTASGTYTLLNNFENLTFIGAGNFTGNGNGAANVITANGGDDTLNGAAGNDTLNGGGGVDTLNGDAGADTLNGGAGDDTLRGGADNDTINGGDGNDTFAYVMGDGADAVNGGADSDTLNITAAAAAADALDVIYDGSVLTSVEGGAVSGVEFVNANLNGGLDTLAYTGSTAAVSVDLSTGTASGFAAIANIENATGGSGNDTLIGSSLVSNNLNGGDGLDALNGGTDNDTLVGGAGDDTYIANNGDTLTEGNAVGSGTDRVFATSNLFTLAANVENLTFIGAGNFTGNGNASANVITSNGGDDTLSGANGDDTLNGGSGVDILSGGGDNDTLNGDAGNDNLNGGAGVDRLVGGADNDSLTGAGGNDAFVFAAGFGNDTITDFDAVPAAQDVLEFSLSSFGFADAAAFNAALGIARIDTNGDTVLDATLLTIGTDTITLLGVNGVGTNVIAVNTADFLLTA